MDHDVYLSALQSQGAALLRHARQAGIDAPVPTCPGWDVRRLLQHVTRVHARTEVVVRTHASGPPSRDELPQRPSDENLFEEAAGVLDRMVAALAAADPDDPAWFFARGGHGVAAWTRRMAHETTLHRADAESADGHPISAVDPELAVDGIDELVSVMLPFAVNESDRVDGGIGATVHLHTTDVDGEWMLDMRGPELAVSREHAKGDLAVRGPASGLFFWAWNRQTASDSGLDTFGDGALLEAWRRLTL